MPVALENTFARDRDFVLEYADPEFVEATWKGRISGEDLWDPGYRRLPNSEVYHRVREKLQRLGKTGVIEARGRMSSIMPNAKTDRSFDCNTICGNTLRARPCDYCYVEDARRREFREKGICLQTRYNEPGDQIPPVRNWRRSTIDKLNRIGGLRLFSFGEYVDTPQCNSNLEKLISEAKQKGLRLKAITKRPDFVERYHDRVDTINVSVDSLGSGVRWSKAKELKQKYPGTVKIRATAVNLEDLKEWVDRPWVDVITPYHGTERCADLRWPNDPELVREMEERRAEGETVRDRVCYQSLVHAGRPIPEVRELMRKHRGRFCCEQGSCGTCVTKCGAFKASPEEVTACKDIYFKHTSDESPESLRENTADVLLAAP